MPQFDKKFVDRNGERYMLPARIEKACSWLMSEYAAVADEAIGELEYARGDCLYADTGVLDWRPFDTENGSWGEPGEYVWFRTSLRIPQAFSGRAIWLTVCPYDDRGMWHWGCPQLQLFVDGKCVCGMDSNHRRYLLTEAAAGESFTLHIKGLADAFYYHGKMRMRLFLQVRRPEVEALYTDITVPLRAAAWMDTDSRERVEIIDKLNRAVSLLELGERPDSAAFRESVSAASRYLRGELYGRREANAPVLHGIGHTHIDVAWLWTYAVTRNKAARSFATAVSLLKRNPDFLFMSSQPQLYQFVKEDAPDVYAQIKAFVREGRWEPEGGMWVESDTNLVSGESLVRQFLYGKRFFREEFGVDNEILWLPDVFGYSAALPQICRRSGIRYFFTTKLSWNEFNKPPYDTFYWRGIDGTELLTHFGCAIRAGDMSAAYQTTYNATTEPEYVLGAWQRYQQKDLNRDLLFCYGHGDGGGGPTQEMLDHAERFRMGIPGCPAVVPDTASGFFAGLEKEVAGHPHMPVWDGELYFEYHRGVYTAQARNKRYNRYSEILYHDAENLAAVCAAVCGTMAEYPQEKLEENWKRILLNQFHDVLPGSSVKEVYLDSDRLYRQVQADGKEMLDRALNRLAQEIGCAEESLAVFNTLSFVRDTCVVCDTQIEGLRDGEGRQIPVQTTYDGKRIFFARGLPSKGYRCYTLCEENTQAASPFLVSAQRLDTPFFSVCFDDCMHITHFVCRRTGRELVPAGEVFGRWLAYDDLPLCDDAWNVNVYYTEKYRVIDDVASVEVLENGPVRCVLRVIRRFRDSVIRQDICAYADIDRLDYVCEVDWREKNLFVKAEFPVDVNAGQCTYDIPFGYLQRPVCKNTLADFARFEVSGHKWADLGDSGMGLAVLNDCKYGYDADRNHLRLSLLRCATYPNPEQDKEVHTFSYAVYPHGGTFLSARVRERGYDFNFPVYSVRLSPGGGALPAALSFLWTDADNIVIETVKKAEDSSRLAVRLYEADNQRTACLLHTAFSLSACVEADLMETPEKTLPVTEHAVALDFRPFEIKTVLLEVDTSLGNWQKPQNYGARITVCRA